MPKIKPVFDVDIESMWNFEFQAKSSFEPQLILASDSLENLKREVKRRGWSLAWISTKTGCMSYGQAAMDEAPYIPRY